MESNVPKVFFSYSWSNQEHEEKVLRLAQRLVNDGVDVVLDKWDLKEGQDKYVYMEQSVNDPSVDKVLLISDAVYAKKADERAGGVGEETIIISPVLYGKVNQEKFIPVVFERDLQGKELLPAYVRSRLYIDLSGDGTTYEQEYDKLLRNIHNKPLYQKPPIGIKPQWLEENYINNSMVQDLLRQIKGCNHEDRKKLSALTQKFMDLFIETTKAFEVQGEVTGQVVVSTIEKLHSMKEMFYDFLDIAILTDMSSIDQICAFFEQLNNTLLKKNSNFAASTEFEYFEYFIWELFISTIAFLYHFQLFSDIHEMLTYTYFLIDSPLSANATPKNFTAFRRYFRLIEENYKPQSAEPRRLSCAADILTTREKAPIWTRDSLSFADILLFQLSCTLLKSTKPHERRWYPISYIYCRIASGEWLKFQSRKYCEKAKLLFGAKTVDELIKIIKDNPCPERFSYQMSAENVNLLYDVDLDNIASMN